MNSPFKYFDKIFVVSARDDEERRGYVEKVFSKMDVSFEFFDAVMGNDLSKKEIENVYDEERAKKHKTYRRPLSKPEIGCALSHIRIYKKIVKENLKNALIFEDDIAPNYEKLDQIDKAFNELPEDWDLLFLGTLDHKSEIPVSFKLKLLFYYPLVTTFFPEKIDYKFKQLQNLYPRDYSKSLKKAGYHRGSHAYAINKSGVEKFLAYHDKIVTPADLMLSVMVVEDKMNAFITREKIFEQNRKFQSTIDGSRQIINKSLNK
ncbi:MAG TPA: glycosyltransferase family 25 protein [Balneolaceae bacterium]|nr:glycosyltransferase family 25 protein [Balneolaceae bacterium]